jgi:tetratricopeptide (TPR) repeat protein
MRRSLPWLVTLALGLALAGAYAEDSSAPAYSASDLAVEEETLPEGWTIVYDEFPDTPGEDAMETWAKAVAGRAGVSEDALSTEIRVLESPQGAHATLLLIEVDGDAGTLPQVIAKAAQTEGWTSRVMGHPSRILVVAAPESIRKTVLDLQMKVSIDTLTRLAYERKEAGSRIGAEAYAKGALAIEPKAGRPQAVLGLVAGKAEDWDAAITAFEKAFAKSAVMPPEGELAHRAWRTYGYALLQKKDEGADKRAVEALEQAIATAGVLEGKEQVFAIYYNLACALSRLKRVEDACGRLETALELAKKRLGPVGFQGYLNGTVMRDNDLDNIRGKPCYQAVIERVTKGVGTSPLDGI